MTATAKAAQIAAQLQAAGGIAGNIGLMQKRKKPKPKPRATCIFCPRVDLSKEHFWPKWMRHLLHPAVEANHHVVSTYTMEFPGGKAFIPPLSTSRRTGPTRSKTMKVVCRKNCNGGWMSVVETEAQRVLTELITGQCLSIDADQQVALSTWIAMKAAVGEHSLPEEDRAIPLSDRRHMESKHCPPQTGWHIVIGKTGGGDRYLYNHFCGKLEAAKPGGADIQSTSLWIGHLFINAISTCADESEYGFDVIPDGTTRIWPPSGVSEPWADRQILTDDQVIGIRDGLQVDLGNAIEHAIAVRAAHAAIPSVDH